MISSRKLTKIKFNKIKKYMRETFNKIKRKQICKINIIIIIKKNTNNKINQKVHVEDNNLVKIQ